MRLISISTRAVNLPPFMSPHIKWTGRRKSGEDLLGRAVGAEYRLLGGVLVAIQRKLQVLLLTSRAT